MCSLEHYERLTLEFLKDRKERKPDKPIFKARFQNLLNKYYIKNYGTNECEAQKLSWRNLKEFTTLGAYFTYLKAKGYVKLSDDGNTIAQILSTEYSSAKVDVTPQSTPKKRRLQMQQRAYAVAPSRASSRAKAMVASLPKSNDDDSDAEFTRVARLIDDNGVYHDEETSNWGPEAKRARLACDTKNGLTFPCPYPGCKKEVPLEFFAEHALYDHKADAQSGIACPLCMYLGKGPEYPAPEADLLMHIADAHESDMKLGETKEALKSYAHRNIMSSLNWGVDLLRCRHPPPHAFEPAVPHVGPVCAAEQPPQPPPPPPPPAQMEQQQQQHDEEQNPPSLFARLCDYFISASQVPQTVAQQQQQQQLQQQQQQQQQAPVVVNNGSEGGEKSRVSKIEYELKEDLQSDCMICMGPMTKGESVTRLECMCVFHTECIGDWLKKKPVCPLHND